MNSKKNGIIAFVMILGVILASVSAYFLIASDGASDDVSLMEATAQITPSPSKIPTATPTITPSPTPIPEKPKYIFIVIGDGMGFSHLLLGSMYEKILYEDSSYLPYWDRFDMQSQCATGIESALGGTMLATGYDGEQTVISMDDEDNELVTIMDRAKQAGMSTGVISNSYIVDATPASFLAHTPKRTRYLDIAAQIAMSDVDYIGASGGLDYFLSDSMRDEYGKYDIRDVKYRYLADDSTLQNAKDNGYLTYMGSDGSDFMGLGDYSFIGEQKVLDLFAAKNTSYRWNKYGTRMEKKQVHEPDLEEMTSTGIDILSRNGEGFVFAIEEALIDKSSHNLWMQITTTEMHVMSETLKVIYEFYEQHPYETLVIFTADHETSDMSYNDEFAQSISTLPDIDWHQDSDTIYNFLKDEWGLRLKESSIREKIDAAKLDIWGSEEKNYTLLHSYIAAYMCEENGLTMNSKYHSRQPVPLYTLGVKAQEFSDCENLYEIPRTICDIMDWDDLPEIFIE